MGSKRVEKVVKTVWGRLNRFVPADRFYVALYDPIRKEIQIPVIITNDGQVNDPVFYSYKANSALPDRIIEQNEMLLLAQMDLEKENDLACWDDSKQPKFWLGFPIRSDGNAVGSLVVERWENAKSFTEDEKQLLMNVAGQTAGHLERARLDDRLEQKITHLQAVNEIGQKITSSIRLNELQILELIYEQATPLMDTSNMYIALYDPDVSQPDEYKTEKPENNKIYGTVRFGLAMNEGVRVNVNVDAGWQSRQAGHGLTEYVIRTKQAFHPANVSQAYTSIATEYIGKTPESWLGVPMVVENRILGVVVLRNEQYENIYSVDDQEILQMLARDAAVALENVRLYEELENKTKQFRALNDIAVDVTSETNLEKLLEKIIDHVNDLLKSDFSTLFVYNARLEKFTHKLRRGNVGNTPSDPPDDGLTYKLVRSQTPKYVEAQPIIEIEGTFIKNKNVKAFAAIPLVFGDITVGVLYINYKLLHSFSIQEKEIISILANQAAVAIENAQKVEALDKSRTEIADRERELVTTSLAMDIIHTINNAAGTISPWVTLVKRNLSEKSTSNHKVVDYLNKISRDAMLILQKAKELREPIFSSEEIDLNELIGSIVGQMEVMTPPDVDVEFSLLPDIPLVCAVEQQLSSAIYSVIHNATKASQDEGQVSITLKQVMRNNAENIQISVSDNGVGISQEKMAYIFDHGISYWSASKRSTGYGLWRAKSIISALGGHIEAKSKERIGTTVSIWVPISSPVASKIDFA